MVPKRLDNLAYKCLITLLGHSLNGVKDIGTSFFILCHIVIANLPMNNSSEP
jgi:hypothetical protein